MLLSKVSHRGCTLITNNLVASSLWHKLAVLNPTVGKDTEESRVAAFRLKVAQSLPCHADICWGDPALVLLVKG